jgi:hypothetical protein
VKFSNKRKKTDKLEEKPDWIKRTLFELVTVLPNVKIKTQRKKTNGKI